MVLGERKKRRKIKTGGGKGIPALPAGTSVHRYSQPIPGREKKGGKKINYFLPVASAFHYKQKARDGVP